MHPEFINEPHEKPSFEAEIPTIYGYIIMNDSGKFYSEYFGWDAKSKCDVFSLTERLSQPDLPPESFWLEVKIPQSFLTRT